MNCSGVSMAKLAGVLWRSRSKMLVAIAAALWEARYGGRRAPGRLWRSGSRAIGLGVAGLAAGRTAFFAFAVTRLAGTRLPGARFAGRLPLPDPLLLFFFAMARSRCQP